MDKKPDKLDDFLRNAVGSYSREPSEKVWNGISGALFLSSLMKIVFSYGWIVLVLLMAGGYLLLGPTLQEEPPQKSVSEQLEKSDSSFNDPAEKKVSSAQEDKHDETTMVKKTQKEKENNYHVAKQPNEDISGTNTPLVSVKEMALQPANSNNSGETVAFFNGLGKSEKNNTNPGKQAIGLVPRRGYLLMASTFEPYNIPERKSNDKLQLNLPKPKDYVRLPVHASEISYLYELSNIGNKSERKKLISHGFEVTGRFISNDWHLSAGAGLIFSKDNGMFDVRYNQYDSVGYYYKVTSFSIDPETGKPDFNTIPENVYDTVDYFFSTQPQNHYTYLVLPVYGGINAYRFKRFGIDLEAGMIYSLLVSEKEEDYAYTNDKALSINIANETPSRIKAYGQVYLGTALTYDIFGRLSIHLSPYVKYHLKPLYEKRYTENKDAWTYGLKTGLFIKF